VYCVGLFLSHAVCFLSECCFSGWQPIWFLLISVTGQLVSRWKFVLLTHEFLFDSSGA
jgi:hypothetical protein